MSAVERDRLVVVLRNLLIVAAMICLVVWMTSGGFVFEWNWDAWPFEPGHFDNPGSLTTTRSLFGIQFNEFAGYAYIRTVSIPAWMPLIALLLCIAAIEKFLRSSRQRVQWKAQGHCTRCGYDLRASPDACPECGTMAR